MHFVAIKMGGWRESEKLEGKMQKQGTALYFCILPSYFLLS
jgi:hypothetical protein